MATEIRTAEMQHAPRLDAHWPEGAVLVLDPEVARRLRAEREDQPGGIRDEVWNGVYVMSPLPNTEHQILAFRFCQVFDSVLEDHGHGIAIPGVNVSDRAEDWTSNYREPDVVVFLEGNPAKDHGTHWEGGPDLLVEILSPRDMSREKLGFYSALGVKEVLLLDRDPWRLELYRREEDGLVLVASVGPESKNTFLLQTLPLSFGLTAGKQRPVIEVQRIDREQEWTL
ncbi:MAG: Uma2 family endonuclease [Isosphaeraceae bacterium]